MLDNHFYHTIFKRKSFHVFRGIGDEKISQQELDDMMSAFESLEKLYPDTKVRLRVMPASNWNDVRGAEYCVLIYSEKNENYLMNAGYLGQQLDLYLVDHNIATLWYGLGKPDFPVWEGLDYVIMFAIHKVSDSKKYRKDMFQSKRKELSDIWFGDTLGIGEIARFAPSACNSQPWKVANDGTTLTVARYTKQSKVGLMSPAVAFYDNRIDIGIFLCILEICMAEKKLSARRELFTDEIAQEHTVVAKYHLL